MSVNDTELIQTGHLDHSIDHISFPFDLFILASKCQQVELLFSVFNSCMLYDLIPIVFELNVVNDDLNKSFALLGWLLREYGELTLYETCLLTYKTLQIQQPTYLYNSLSFPSHSLSTRSYSDSSVLSIPYVRTSLGKRAFSVIAPRL